VTTPGRVAALEVVKFFRVVHRSQGASFSSSSSNPATRSDGVLEYCANWELHLASAGLGVLSRRSRRSRSFRLRFPPPSDICPG
jgi:hypothetical protein